MSLVAPSDDPPDWKRYDPDPTPDPEPSSAKSPVPYAPPSPPAPVRSLQERTVRQTGFHPAGLVIVAAVLVLVAGIVVAIMLAAQGGDDEVAADGTPIARADRPQSDKGFAGLLEALEEETGSTIVVEAVIYPKYAVVTVPYKPDKPGDERVVRYYWNGDELDESTKSTAGEEPFDLAQVSGDVLSGLCVHTRDLVEDPGDCYLIVRKPGAEDTTQSWISAYTSNEFSQGGYIQYDLAGTELKRATW